MNDIDRKTFLILLKSNLDKLVEFADQEKDFLLAAKLDDARLRFANQYIVTD